MIAAHQTGVEVRLITEASKFSPVAYWQTEDDRLLAAGVPLLGVGRMGNGAMHSNSRFLTAPSSLPGLSIGLAVVLGLALLPVVVTIVHKLMDRGLTLNSIVKKFSLYVLLPPVSIGLAKMTFGAGAVDSVMMWAGPVLLALPLLGFLGRRHGARNAA